MSTVVDFRTRQPIIQKEWHENVLEHVRREPLSLPAWVIEDAALNKEVYDLWNKGWKVNVVALPCARWIEFRHHQVKPVGRDFLYLDEAIDTQRMMDAAKAIKL